MVRGPQCFSCPKLLGLLLTAVVAAPASSWAQDAAVSDGVFIAINYPLTDREVARITEATNLVRHEYRNKLKAAGLAAPAPLKVVYEFNPEGQPSGLAPYESCRALAAYLLGLTDVTTIAFLRADVTRHAVLPVLACQEIVMAKAARLGDAQRDQDQQLWKDQLVFYREVAEKRGRSPAVVLKMLDKNLEVFEATRNGSVWYVEGGHAPEPGLLVDPARGPVLVRGKVALFTSSEAQKFGLCRRLVETRADLANWYGIPKDRLRDDPLLGRAPLPWRIEVRGQLTPVLKDTVQRRINRAIGQKANFIILQLECSGGDPVLVGSLAEYLRDLKDTTGQHPVMTVAYVTARSSDTACILALACTQIVLDKQARLGDFEPYLKDRASYQQALGQLLQGLAEQKHYPPLLVRGLVDPSLVLYRVKNAHNPLETNVVTEEMLRAQPEQWLRLENEPLKVKDTLLTLSADRAQQLGLAQHVVENLDQLYGQYKLDGVQQTGPDWLDRLAAFLRSPVVRFFLVMIGITCGILELKAPGMSLPGVLSALCFVLFFWAHAQLAFTWLAVLLFLLGVVLLAIEIFVTPGFAVPGVSGILLLLCGLGLATLERWPQTESEWVTTVGGLGKFGLSLVGGVVGAIVLGRYLPYIPYANRMILLPPTERVEGEIDEAGEAVLARRTALLGAIGVTATPLRPAGMVRFGDDYVDVVAEGSYVEPGARVQVVEIEAHRVVVKEV